MVWLCRAATSPQHNGSRVNRQRSRGMLDSVTSHPEFCYSALSSAETACPMLCLPKLRLILPQPEAPQDGKKHTSLTQDFSLLMYPYTQTQTQTHRQELKCSVTLPPQLSEQFCHFNSFSPLSFKGVLQVNLM